MTGKTLKELNVQPGDVVSDGYRTYTIGVDSLGRLTDPKDGARFCLNSKVFYLVSRAVDTPKLWHDMTPEEKGALLLAHHEGKVIEFRDDDWWVCDDPSWAALIAYRIRPEPKVETVTIRWQPSGATVYSSGKGYTHRITFNLIDGKPDCDSVKMEKL